jgi:hypothetical protein
MVEGEFSNPYAASTGKFDYGIIIRYAFPREFIENYMNFRLTTLPQPKICITVN